MRTRLLFGGLVAVILLALYAYATIYAIQVAQCVGRGLCKADPKGLSEGIETVLNLVGGLVSALVIARLAITQPGESPGAGLLGPGAGDTAKNMVTIIAVAYIAVWVACGLAALIVGFMKYPEAVPELTASAKSWLGLAVAAGYSYLGVRPA